MEMPIMAPIAGSSVTTDPIPAPIRPAFRNMSVRALERCDGTTAGDAPSRLHPPPSNWSSGMTDYDGQPFATEGKQ